MNHGFQLFGFAHLAILGLVALTPAVLAWVARRRGSIAVPVARGMAVALIVNELGLYGFKYSQGWFVFPQGMPLQLCDLAVWITAAALLIGAGRVFDCAYYIGLAGTAQALLTPDLQAPWPSYPTITFFLSHGLVVGGVLYLIWSGLARPARGSIWRAFLALNAFAAFVGFFNFVYGTNFMYLRAKPANASLLDQLGPWPYYIVVGEALALGLFGLLWLPFRSPPSRRGD